MTYYKAILTDAIIKIHNNSLYIYDKTSNTWIFVLCLKNSNKYIYDRQEFYEELTEKEVFLEIL